MSIEVDYKQDQVNLVCDRCGLCIASTPNNGIDEAKQKLPIKESRDLNRGHECTSCRTSREREYDAYVLSYRYF